MLRTVWISILVLFCGYALLLGFGSIEGFPSHFKENVSMPYLSDRPVGEDGFYMLTVAWNIPIEKKICYNFSIPTAGIQPLNTFVFSFIAYFVQSFGGNKWDFVRAVILFESLNLLLFSVFIYFISLQLVAANPDKLLLKIYCGAFALFNFTLFKLFTYGLETAVYLNLFALTVLFSLKIFLMNKIVFRKWVLFSFLMGVTVLIRLDFGIICIGILVILLVQRIISFRRFLLACFMVFVIVTPWLFYVKYVTNSWIPSSGLAQSEFIVSFDDFISRLIISLTALLDHSVPFIYSANRMFLGVLCLLVLTAVIIFYKKFNTSNTVLERVKLKFLLYWLISVMPVVIIYTFYFTSVHFYIRYFAPLAVIFIPVFTVVLYSICLKFKSGVLKLAPVMVSVLSFFVYSYFFFHSGYTGWSRTISSGYIYNSDLQSNRIGAFQSGVLGYFNSNVFNLDGKIDHGALKYLKENRIDRYIDSMKIDYISDWPLYLSNIDSSYLSENWSRVSNAPQDSSLYYKRIKYPSEFNSYKK